LEVERIIAERTSEGEGNVNICRQHVCSAGQGVQDDHAHEEEHCPCMDGNPFMHVLTEVHDQTCGQWEKKVSFVVWYIVLL
jgi:hypothetical protein